MCVCVCVDVSVCEREREIVVGSRKFISASSLIFIIKAFDSHVVSVFILNWLKIEKEEHSD